MDCNTSHLAIPQQHGRIAGVFLYTGQVSSDIPHDVTRVRVHQSVKVIHAGAFERCHELTEVELCEGLAKIEHDAFCNCRSLKSINIPSTVRVIEMRTFHYCSQLEEVRLCEGLKQINDEAFSNCVSLKYIKIPSTVKVIGDGAFCYCSRLEEVGLCEGLEQIRQKAFWYNASLKYIKIPSTVKVISKIAFFYCEQLENVDLSEGLEEIEDIAFQYCKYLNSISIPSTVKMIGEGAFAYCVRLEKIQLCEGLEEIGEGAFSDCLSLKRIKIPLTVKVIENCTFRYCKQLEEANLSESLEQIGEDAFYNCKSLRHIGISTSAKAVCEKSLPIECRVGLGKVACTAFYNCKSLNGAIFPPKLKEISGQTIANFRQLVSVELCDGIQRIGKSSFQYCPSLRNIAIPPKAQTPHYFGQGCYDLLQVFGSQQLIVNALSSRFNGLPIHKLCYYQSYNPTSVTIQQIEDNIESMSNQIEGSLNTMNTADNTQDCLGMTPLHILACSRKHAIDLYQCIVYHQPSSLITEDKWGCVPILYAVWGNAPQEILQYLIGMQKNSFPDHCLNWEKMIETLCRAGMSPDIVRILIDIQQASFPQNKVDWQKVARELTILPLITFESSEDPFTIWMSMMETFSASQAHTDLVQSLLEIQERFFPAQIDTSWEMMCHEFVKPLKEWWPHNISPNTETFRFLVKCRIPERLNAIKARKWKAEIFNSMESLKTIHSRLVSYEQFKEAITILELALWKSKLSQSDGTEDHYNSMKVQCRINCGACVIMPNVLSFLEYLSKDDSATSLRTLPHILTP